MGLRLKKIISRDRVKKRKRQGRYNKRDSWRDKDKDGEEQRERKKEIERNKEKKREAHTKKKIENVPQLDLRMLLWLEFKLNSFSLI